MARGECDRVAKLLMDRLGGRGKTLPTSVTAIHCRPGSFRQFADFGKQFADLRRV